jgi:sulfate/thiosulfate-binding protein
VEENEMRRAFLIVLFALAVIAPAAAQDKPKSVTLTLAGYAVPREAFGDIIPLFQAKWQKETGQQVIVQEAYQGSGAQSRAIVGGFEADVAALSVEPDIQRIADANLITHDWKDSPYKGILTNSVVVLVVRPDNPRGIKDWADLTQDGLEVITPDPATSGGAQWNILAAWGAALRGHVEGFDATEDGATGLLQKFIPNISVLDKDGRESFLTFERGIGDVAITYENEVYAGLLAGGEYQIVYPSSTILIQAPVAVIDSNVDKHGTREVAEAFVQYLWSPEAQRVFAQHGFRPVNPDVAKEVKVGVAPDANATAEPGQKVVIVFPPVTDQFTIDELGGWKDVRAMLFGDDGIFTKTIAEVRG